MKVRKRFKLFTMNNSAFLSIFALIASLLVVSGVVMVEVAKGLPPVKQVEAVRRVSTPPPLPVPPKPGQGEESRGPRVLSAAEKPRCLKPVPPEYPSIDMRNKYIKGDVQLRVVIDIHGKVIRTIVVSGHPLLRTQAFRAVSRRVYAPYIEKGAPRPAIFTETVSFDPVGVPEERKLFVSNGISSH